MDRLDYLEQGGGDLHLHGRGSGLRPTFSGLGAPSGGDGRGGAGGRGGGAGGGGRGGGSSPRVLQNPLLHKRRASDYLERILGSSDGSVRSEGIAQLHDLDAPQVAVLLREGDSGMRTLVLKEVGGLDPRVQSAVAPTVLELLEDGLSSMRTAAVGAVQALCEAAQIECAGVLVARLRHHDSSVRGAVIEARAPSSLLRRHRRRHRCRHCAPVLIPIAGPVPPPRTNRPPRHSKLTRRNSAFLSDFKTHPISEHIEPIIPVRLYCVRNIHTTQASE